MCALFLPDFYCAACGYFSTYRQSLCYFLPPTCCGNVQENTHTYILNFVGRVQSTALYTDSRVVYYFAQCLVLHVAVAFTYGTTL